MVTVRVVPRSGRRGLEAHADPPVVRVRAAPEGGRATEEARRTLAEAIGVAPSRVGLRSGSRSRVKVFEVRGITTEEIKVRLRAT